MEAGEETEKKVHKHHWEWRRKVSKEMNWHQPVLHRWCNYCNMWRANGGTSITGRCSVDGSFLLWVVLFNSNLSHVILVEKCSLLIWLLITSCLLLELQYWDVFAQKSWELALRKLRKQSDRLIDLSSPGRQTQFSWLDLEVNADGRFLHPLIPLTLNFGACSQEDVTASLEGSGLFLRSIWKKEEMKEHSRNLRKILAQGGCACW